MWIIMALLSAFFAGITSILAKIGMNHIDSDIATTLRCVIILFFSWGIVFITGAISELFQISTSSLLYLILSGISTGISWLCYFHALALGDVNKIVAIDKSSIILTTITAIILFNENNFLSVKIICILLIFIGLMLMTIKDKVAQNLNKIASSKSYIYAILSAVFATLTAIFGKYGIDDIDSNLGTAIRVCVIFIISYLIVFIKKKSIHIAKIPPKDLFFIILSAITTGLSWLCYYYALQNGIMSIIVAIDKMSIVVAVVFSYLIFKEKLNLKSFCGLILLIIGTLIMTLYH